MPSGIRQEFELKDCHRDCQDCYLDRDFQSSGRNNDLSCSPLSEDSQNDSSDKKGNDSSSQEISKNRNGTNTPGGKLYSGLIIGGIVITSLISFATILIIKGKKKAKK